MTTRRDFLRTVGAAAAVSALPARLRAEGGADRIGRVGVQLYTVRSAMAANVEDTLARVAAIGYREVEFAGYFGRDPVKLRATLDRLGLTAPSAHVGIDAFEGGWRESAAAAHALGHEWLTVASVSPNNYQSADAVKALAGRFNAAAKKARADGLKFAYHNHNIEFKPLEPAGAVPYDLLLAGTDPALVDFEMDLYWIVSGGGDPMAEFSRNPGRFKMVHVKDSGGPPANEMREVGAGTINWKALFARHREAGIEHYFVEHDEPKNPFESITSSYRYLSALEF